MSEHTNTKPDTQLNSWSSVKSAICHLTKSSTLPMPLSNHVPHRPQLVLLVEYNRSLPYNSAEQQGHDRHSKRKNEVVVGFGGFTHQRALLRAATSRPCPCSVSLRSPPSCAGLDANQRGYT